MYGVATAPLHRHQVAFRGPHQPLVCYAQTTGVVPVEQHAHAGLVYGLGRRLPTPSTERHVGWFGVPDETVHGLTQSLEPRQAVRLGPRLDLQEAGPSSEAPGTVLVQR